jgi:hypothetical protein
MAKALRQKDGKIDPAELDAVIAIVSGQRPKSELEAMVVCLRWPSPIRSRCALPSTSTGAFKSWSKIPMRLPLQG